MASEALTPNEILLIWKQILTSIGVEKHTSDEWQEIYEDFWKAMVLDSPPNIGIQSIQQLFEAHGIDVADGEGPKATAKAKKKLPIAMNVEAQAPSYVAPTETKIAAILNSKKTNADNVGRSSVSKFTTPQHAQRQQQQLQQQEHAQRQQQQQQQHVQRQQQQQQHVQRQQQQQDQHVQRQQQQKDQHAQKHQQQQQHAQRQQQQHKQQSLQQLQHAERQQQKQQHRQQSQQQPIHQQQSQPSQQQQNPFAQLQTKNFDKDSRQQQQMGWEPRKLPLQQQPQEQQLWKGQSSTRQEYLQQNQHHHQQQQQQHQQQQQRQNSVQTKSNADAHEISRKSKLFSINTAKIDRNFNIENTLNYNIANDSKVEPTSVKKQESGGIDDWLQNYNDVPNEIEQDIGDTSDFFNNLPPVSTALDETSLQFQTLVHPKTRQEREENKSVVPSQPILQAKVQTEPANKDSQKSQQKHKKKKKKGKKEKP